MKIRTPHLRSSRALLAWLSRKVSASIGTLATVILLINPGLSRLQAQDLTWQGLGTNNNWTTSSNWNATVTAGSSLFFGGSTRLTPTNDFAAGTAFSNLTFNSGAGAFVVGGNGIMLAGNLTNNQGSGETLAMPITCTDTRIVSVVSNGTLSATGPVSGAGGFTKTGPGRLTLGGTNSFSGAVTVTQGTLRLDNDAALGSISGITAINSGATLDIAGPNTGVNGLDTGSEPIFASGSGVNGLGAIANLSVASSQMNALHTVTLTGDTTFGGTGPWTTSGGNPGRWDIRGTPSTAFLSTGGQPYNLTKTGSNEVRLAGITVDPALANIAVTQGAFGIEGNTTSLGNPTGTLTVSPGATLEFVSATNRLNKIIALSGNGATQSVDNRAGNNTAVGSVTLSNECVFQIAASTTLTNRGPISGSGSLTKTGAGTLHVTSTNAFTGNTTVKSGTLALSGNGSISTSPTISLAFGATLDASGRTNNTLTVASGQTLTGSGFILGQLNVATGGRWIEAYDDLLTVNSTVNLSGLTALEINRTNTPNSASITGISTLTYGGTLAVTNVGPALQLGDSFTLFEATNYTGAFLTIYLPPLPPSLAWNTSSLATNGQISVAATPQVVFAGIQHSSLGNASLNFANSLLTVSNLGSGGTDGVSIDVTNSGGLDLHWAAPALVVNGDSISVTTKGVVNGIPSQQLAVASATRGGNVILLSASFPLILASEQSVELYLEGKLVAAYGGLTSNLVVQASKQTGVLAPPPCGYRTYIHWESDPIWMETIWANNDNLFANTNGPCDPYSIIVNGSGPVLSDEVRFVSAHMTNLIQTLDRVEVTCTEPNGLTIQAEALRVFAYPNSALGSAHLQAENDGAKLLISNLGTNGQDGIKIPLDHAYGFGLGINADSVWGHPGIEFKNVARGQIGTGSEQNFGMANVTGSSNGMTLNVNFAALGANTVRVKIFGLTNNLIHSEDMPNNGTIFITGSNGGSSYVCDTNIIPRLYGGWVMFGKYGPNVVWQTAWTGACSPLTVWTTNNPGSPVQAHGISVEPLNVSSNPATLSSVALTTSNLNQFALHWEGVEPQMVTYSFPFVSAVQKGSNLVVSFSGTLQSANSVTGPWTNLAAVSPLVIEPRGGQQYYQSLPAISALTYPDTAPNLVWGVNGAGRIFPVDPYTGVEPPYGKLMQKGGPVQIGIPLGIAKVPNTVNKFTVCTITDSCAKHGTGFYSVDDRDGSAVAFGLLENRYIQDIEYNPVNGQLYGFETDGNGHYQYFVRIKELGSDCHSSGTAPDIEKIATALELSTVVGGVGPYSVAFAYDGECNIVSAKDHYRARVTLPTTSAPLSLIQRYHWDAPGVVADMTECDEVAFCISKAIPIIHIEGKSPIATPPFELEDVRFFHISTTGLYDSWVKKGEAPYVTFDYTSTPADPYHVFIRDR